MTLQEVTLLTALKGSNIPVQFDTLPNTIKLLGNELGHVIKQQAGVKYYKIVEEIRQKSKNIEQLKMRNISTIFSIFLKISSQKKYM